jgi:hypothetical protein
VGNLPDLEHITTLAISGMMMIVASISFRVVDLIVAPVGSEQNDLLVVLFLPTCHLLSFAGETCILL